MVSGISLANKCQLLFGFAIVVILTTVLSVPWVRTSTMVQDSQLEVARQLSEAWLKDRIQLGTLEQPGSSPSKLDEFLAHPDQTPVLRMTLVPVTQFASYAWIGFIVLGAFLGGVAFAKMIWVAIAVDCPCQRTPPVTFEGQPVVHAGGR